METLQTHRCPECAGTVAVPEVPLVSEIVVCSECATDLEVVAVDPLLLALAPEIEEDWGE